MSDLLKLKTRKPHGVFFPHGFFRFGFTRVFVPFLTNGWCIPELFGYQRYCDAPRKKSICFYFGNYVFGHIESEVYFLGNASEVLYFAFFCFPTYGNFAFFAVVTAFGVREFAANVRSGAKRKLDKAGAVDVGADSEAVLEHPLGNASERVVVERIHAGVAEALFFGVTVPSLPHGGGTVYRAITPTGIFATA